MPFIPIEAREVDLAKIGRIKSVEIVLRDQNLEQISDQMIVRQIEHRQKVSKDEMARTLPYYGNSLPLITRAGRELYELRMQNTQPAFNLVSLPQYRTLKREGVNGVFSLGPGFDETGIEVLDLLMLQLFSDQPSLIENIRVVVEDNFKNVRRLLSRIFAKNQYLFSANTIK